MSWEHLTRIAILGTDKGKLSTELLKELADNGLDVTKKSADLLLDAAALYANMRKAARPALDFEEALPEAAAADSNIPCTAISVAHLNEILDETYEEALPEFLGLLSKNDKILPPEALPELFDRSLKSKSLWTHLQANIGTKGQWLLLQNPDWSNLIIDLNQADWELAPKQKRIQILDLSCKENPEKAIELLASTWQTESLTNKKAFLKVLAENIHASFESFLESRLDENRKEIRLAAAEILTRIPTARLVERMFGRLDALMEFKGRIIGKPKIKIELPEEVDKALIRDGLNIKAQGLRGGLLTARFEYMMSIVPPSRWEQEYKQKPNALLSVFIRSEWSELLIQSMINAAARHRDETWMELLLDFWMENAEEPKWQKLDIQALLLALPDHIFNKIAIQKLDGQKGFLEESDPLVILLKSAQHFWDDRLVILFLQNIKSWLSAQGSRYWSGWHYKGILNKVAYTCSPNLYDVLLGDWTRSAGLWQGWEQQIEAFLRTVKFRKEMTEALGEEN